MAGRIGWLVAFFRRAEPRDPAPSGWALALDAAVAVGAAAGAVYEMAKWSVQRASLLPGRAGVPVSAGRLVHRVAVLGDPLLITRSAAHVSAAALIAAALTALPLAARRRYPITVWLVITAAIVAAAVIAYVPAVALGTAVYAAYSAVMHSRYRNLAIAVVAVVTITVSPVLGKELPRFSGLLTAFFAIGPAAVAGLGIRELRHRLAASAARLDRAAADARAATQRALAEERARIASELHDVVTHNVSVMIVQAGAARKIMASSRAEAEDALLAVEATGRDAMAELRNLLGLLSPAADGRESGPGACSPGTPAPDVPASAWSPAAAGTGAAGTRAAGTGAAGTGAAGTGADGTGADGTGAGQRPDGGRAALRPQPGLGELDTLIGRVSATGLPVVFQVSGEPRPLSPGADLAAYRVVQEGLTNVLRHSGRTGATVGVEWGENLVITVRNDGGDRRPGGGNAGDSSGPGHDGGGSSPPGRGLLGLRERLALYGGELAAGPQPGGGWQMRAVMPAETAS